MQDRKLPARVLENALDLPFDQYQRYRIVADAIGQLRGSSGPLRILDVDGDGAIINFLPEDQITILDHAEPAREREIALPFDDEAFDYVLSVDTYRRLEPEVRSEFLSEIRRTARSGVLLSAPFDSDAVREAERVVDEFRRAVLPAEDAHLREFPRGRLPDLDEARRFFEGHEDAVFVLPNGYTPHWLAMTCLASYGSELEGESGEILGRVNTFYNEILYKLDNTEPCYRHLLVSLRQPADVDLSELASFGSVPERASHSATLFGTLSAVLPLVAEVRQLSARLAEHDRRSVQKEGTLARKEAQVSDLSQRLAEQASRRTILQLRASQRIQALERERNTLLRQKEDLQRQLEGITNSRAWRLLNHLNTFRMKILGSR
jgi:hypothetical protein